MPPGWHRLIELKAWTALPCYSNANQVCGTFKSAQLNKEASPAHQQERVDAAARAREQRWGLGTRFTADPFNADELQVTTYSDRARRLHAAVENATDGAVAGARSNRRQMVIFLGLMYATRAKQIADRDREANRLREIYLNSYPVLQTVLNFEQPQPRATAWRTGRDALYATRCSDALHKLLPNEPAIRCCTKSTNDAACWTADEYPYADPVPHDSGCTKRALELADAPIDRPTNFYTDRLAVPEPPPPSPAPPSPPPPAAPPASPSPPGPPVAITRDQVMAKLYEAQRGFCDSVYVLSAEARCTQLALTLQEAFVFEGDSWTPPSFPPIAPDVDLPPLPPPPPSPKVPEGEQSHLTYLDGTPAYLSSYFVADERGGGFAGSDATGARTPLAQADATREAVLDLLHTGAAPFGQWAACANASAPLPCRTADTKARCLDGARRCQDDYLENMRNPWVELDLLQALPAVETHDTRYFFALEIVLPPEREYGELLFRGVAGTVDEGYEVHTYDQHHNPTPVRCQTWQAQRLTAYSPGLRAVQYVCLDALAGENAYAAMRAVRHVRLVLPGELRMVWVDSLRAVFRTLRDSDPSPPPPPGKPPSPPSPSFPPDAPAATGDCDFYEGGTEADFGVSASAQITIEEPCGLAPKACCALAHEEGAYLFFVGLSGCCMLYKDGALTLPGGLDPPVAASGLDALGRKGVGVVV